MVTRYKVFTEDGEEIATDAEGCVCLGNDTSYNVLILPLCFVVRGTGRQIGQYLAELEAENFSWDAAH